MLRLPHSIQRLCKDSSTATGASRVTFCNSRTAFGPGSPYKPDACQHRAEGVHTDRSCRSTMVVIADATYLAVFSFDPPPHCALPPPPPHPSARQVASAKTAAVRKANQHAKCEAMCKPALANHSSYDNSNQLNFCYFDNHDTVNAPDHELASHQLEPHLACSWQNTVHQQVHANNVPKQDARSCLWAWHLSLHACITPVGGHCMYATML